MHIVHVFIHVIPEHTAEFVAATLENVRCSLEESGIECFDFIRQTEDNTRFALIEVYRTKEDQARHKETAHYKRWQSTVEPFLAEPRTRIVYEYVTSDESR
jgi:autoinducer 2-degrading protein